MTLTLTHREWSQIYKTLIRDLGVTGVLSWNLKKNFGFTIRHHRGYDIIKNKWLDDIRLDFYEESAATYFRLKYYDYLEDKEKDYD